MSMAVVYGPPELFPTLVAVYVCACGRRVAAAGVHAGDAPHDWVRIGDDDYLCEHCAAQAVGTSGREPRGQTR